MERYLSQREELLRAAEPGPVSARRLARLTDDVLVAMAQAASCAHLPPRVRWSLVALGGYGSGALLPESDLDLLVVSDASRATLRPFAEALLYPLWDAGLKVGHQVRSRKEQLRAVREDLATLTATLTGRVVAGDARLGLDVVHACAADARRRRRALLAEIARRERPGSPYLLEPDLKEGAGGRRDFDELTWTAAMLSGTPQRDPSALVSLGLLTDAELSRLSEAADVVAAARWELQLAGSGSYLAEENAAEMATDPHRVQTALADTHHLLLAARRRIAGIEDAPDGPMSAEEVLSHCRRGRSALPALEEAAWAGRLERLLPGFQALMTLRRLGIGHTLTVGAHCLATATVVGEIARGEAGDEVVRRSATACSEIDSVIVAALAHDVGKIVPGAGHAKRGMALAARAARAFGLDNEADSVAALVCHHLLLAETAASRDLDDEAAILAVAEKFGDRSLVPALHVLSVADAIATGPGAWSQWHAALFGKLVMRLDAALAEEVLGAGISGRAEQTRAAIRSSIDTRDPRYRFVSQASPRYLAERSAEEVLRQAGLAQGLAQMSAPGAHAVDITVGPTPDSYRVTVLAHDRHGLFATIAGVIALSGLDILGAETHSVPSGIALDTFIVHSATLASIEPDTWAKLERNLDLALKDRLAVAVRLAERRRHYRSSTRSPAPGVEIHADDPNETVLRIKAADRVGLLHDIARAIADSGLDIRSATALTHAGLADDTFRLTGANAGAPCEVGSLGQLRMRLRDAL